MATKRPRDKEFDVTLATIVSIYRYPVKGLSAEALPRGVDLVPGEPIPLDRAYAIENGPGAFDPSAPRHLPKVTFLCLMRNERLAGLQTSLTTDDGKHRLFISRSQRIIAAGDLKTADGRSAIEAFFARDFAADLRGRPRVVSSPGHSFSDVREKCLHIVNLASIRALEKSLGRSIDPMRFRPNITIDGLPAWAELGFVGRTITLGGATLEAFKRTERCAATNVDPATAHRSGDLPRHLDATLGHRDLGVYATVKTGGTITPGDQLSLGS